jgi:hypothetical protein
MLAGAAKKMKLAGLHYWSLARDKQCAQPTPAASPACSGITQQPYDFRRAFGK